jgi:predicted ATPase/DNA-binding SARP family transcriptional activator
MHDTGRALSSSPPPACRIQLLGELHLTCAGQEVPRSFTRKIGGLLAYLACFLHRSHSREALIELFWPDVDFEAGRASLRSALPVLRRLLAPLPLGEGNPASPLLVIDRLTVRLDPEQVTTDVAEFERALQAASRATSPGEAVALWEQAVSLYGGELLAGYSEPWVLAERQRLAAASMRALRRWATARSQQGDLAGAIEVSRRAVQANPLEEAAHFDLIRYYAAAGQSGAARRHYLDLERLLKAELGASPSQRLPEFLAAAEPVALTSDRQTERPVEQEATAAAPRLALPPLPVPLTPFFGREAEIARVCSLLEGASTRLVTLTGLGGTGKTRLALEVAHRLQTEGADWAGVAFVSLVDLTDPGLLGQTLRGALNLLPAGNTDPLEQIASYLAGQRFLLVLDNFEQLLETGPATVQQLLERAPGLVCLVTSRRPLGLTAEVDYPVPPLPTPVAAVLPEHLSEFASVRLFLNRAQAARSDFQVTAANAEAVAQLCNALEGIPLALELAAARSPVLTPAQMLQHLSDRFGFLVARHRDVPERHRTLRATLEWSYHSLPEHQQWLLSRLSVFRGGWTLEAAEAVCGETGVGCWVLGVEPESGPATPDTQHPTPLLDALLDLRNAALVIAEEAGEVMRFRMLEMVREYARERLDRSGEAAAIRNQHRDWYLQLAEQSDVEGHGLTGETALEARLEAELDNFRAALAWCQEEKEQAEAGLRLAGALGRFWKARGYLSEGRAALAQALDGTKDAGVPPIRANALSWAGELALSQRDYPAARVYYEECLAIYRQLEDPEGLAIALNGFGSLAEEQSNFPEARRLHEESLAIRRQLGDPVGIALALNLLGNVALEQGDLATAKARYEESQSISAELGDRQGVYTARQLLGVVAEHEGDLELARTIYAECLPVWRELRQQIQAAWGLHGLGYVAYRQGDFPAARSLLIDSLRMFQEMETTHGLDLTLQRLGGLAVAQGQMQRAARLLAAGGHQRASTRTVLSLATQQEIEQSVAAVREVLGEEAFTKAWAAGEAMTLGEAIRCALETDDA